MKLSDILIRFIEYQTLSGHSDKTITAYIGHLKRFSDFVGDPAADKLTEEQIYAYMLHLSQQTPKLAAATIRSYLAHLKALLHWAGEKGYVAPNLYKTIILPKVGKKVVKVYSEDEIRQIFDTIKAFPHWIEVRNKLIVALMLDSGLRQNEVSTLQTADIDLNLRAVKVYGKGNKERFVPLGELSLALLSEYMRLCPYRKGIFLFKDKLGEPITNNAIKLFINKLQRKLGYPISSHRLRHNFATNYVLDQYAEYKAIDIYRLMALMGHEEMSTTRNYIHTAQQIIACRSNISHLDRIGL